MPARGRILDVGSREATYVGALLGQGREVYCLDPRDCRDELPAGVTFHHQSLLGNRLPEASFDCVMLLSTLEHIGLPFYGQPLIPRGDELALAEVWRLLRRGGRLVLTTPAGSSKLATWYRQYAPADFRRLLHGWRYRAEYLASAGEPYRSIPETDVERYDYVEHFGTEIRAGAVALVVAERWG